MIRKFKFGILFIFLITSLCSYTLYAQLPPIFNTAINQKTEKSALSKYYITPQRIVWKSDSTDGSVINEDILLHTSAKQAYFENPPVCKLINKKGFAGIVLDFGREIHGGLQIITSQTGERRNKN